MCSAFEKLIPRFANGDLPLREARRVELHLALCEPCRRALVKLHEGAYAPPHARPYETPEEVSIGSLRSRLMASWSQDSVELKLKRSFGRQWWLVAAGCVLLVIIGVFITH
jgi:hypothetical protein